MVRIIIKGGVWRNTEDEILKAAISKYGKNQWARISSLLVRKTPKQCKARWFEWLDPSIKKVEWSKTEDEKLLHLAKLMPTQWRTIAPIVGRTATQCLERYQKLLDDAEAKDNEELGLGGGDDPEMKPAMEDVRKLKAGEIDTDPETRAARPDPIDMDDDEKEMLSEARARLANTQGKKAKRKAREKQLEEARRLAILQKRREMKAAGIVMRYKPKIVGMDYNADIPFNKQPAPGFYDVSEENAKEYDTPVGKSLREVDGKRRRELEEYEEKDKRRKGANKDGKAQNTQFVAAREAQIKKLKEAEKIVKRRRLNLPTPQVGEAELEDIVKIGQAGEFARELVGGGADGATDQLLGDYDSVSRARMARTPRTAPQGDHIMTEARNLRNMTAQQTPLLGDENTPLHVIPGSGSGFEGATPRREVAATPNPLATPMRQRDALATPRSEAGTAFTAATPMRTPMRDSLSINQDGESAYGETPRESMQRQKAAQRALRAGFANLPKPENNYELGEPDEDEEEEVAPILSEEDAAERDARLKAEREEQERLEYARRSAVVKAGLPRPANVDTKTIFRDLSLATADDVTDDLAAAFELVNFEVARLMKHDSVAHPLPGTSTPGGTPSDYIQPADDAVAAAKAAIHAELAEAMELPGASETHIRAAIAAAALEDDSAFDASWAKQRPSLIYSPSARGWIERDQATPAERIESLTALIEADRERLVAEATKASKAEKKLVKQLGGYQMLNGKAKKAIVDAMEELQGVKRDIDTFTMLRVFEEAGAPARIEVKREEVARLERRERDLQARYADLNDRRRELAARVEQLEEDKLVAAAQAALDDQEQAVQDGMDDVAVGDSEMNEM